MPAIMFDSRNVGWRDDPEANLRYLKRIQADCNYILKEKGYLFLQDIFDRLNMRNPYETETYGWWIEDAELPWNVENYISFGLYDNSIPENRKFINGFTPNAKLVFNVTGDLAKYLLDKAMRVGGLEVVQDVYDYPWRFIGGLEWEDYIK